jgi:hypothetical protein
LGFINSRYRGQTIVKGSKYSSSLNVDQKLYYLAKLEIANTEETDSGEYRAEAINVHGKCVATINLNLNEDKGHLKLVMYFLHYVFKNIDIT